MTGYVVGTPHPTAYVESADLPLDLVCIAITAGATPRAVETAITERGRDTLLALAIETGVSLTIIAALQDRWGIRLERYITPRTFR